MSSFISKFITITGSLFILIFFIYPLKLFGRIKVLGLEKVFDDLVKEKVILTPNHPSLLEPILIPVLFLGESVKRFIFRLEINSFDKMPLSVVDGTTFMPKFMHFLYPHMRLMIFDRKDKISTLSMIKVFKKKVSENIPVIIFSEGGRTYSPRVSHKPLLKNGNREVRDFDTGVVRIAVAGSAYIVPVFVDLGAGTSQKLSIFGCAFYLLTSGKMIIYFGEKIFPDKDFDEKKLVQKLLEV